MKEDRTVLTRGAPPPDETLSYGTERDQIAEVRLPRKSVPRPLLLLVHGGYWRPAIDRLHLSSAAFALCGLGYTVALIEYRRIPGAPEHMLADVSAALEQLPGRIASHDGRVILIGHSAGGHLALWAGALRPASALAGVLALAPLADLHLADTLCLGGGAVREFLGSKAIGPFDPRLMPAPPVATTIIHGDADAIVPAALSESYVGTHPRTRWVKLHEVGHFALIDPDNAAWDRVTEEVARLATARESGSASAPGP